MLLGSLPKTEPFLNITRNIIFGNKPLVYSEVENTLRNEYEKAQLKAEAGEEAEVGEEAEAEEEAVAGGGAEAEEK